VEIFKILINKSGLDRIVMNIICFLLDQGGAPFRKVWKLKYTCRAVASHIRSIKNSPAKKTGLLAITGNISGGVT
jgi:hypothetical protein